MNSSEKSSQNLGLVLSGGGAKGAYHVGVLQALREKGIANKIDMIAGASIGALNGAVLASAPNLDDGIQRLEALWNYLPQTQVIKSKYALKTLTQNKLRMGVYFALLLSAGLRFTTPIGWVLNAITLFKIHKDTDEIEQLADDQVLKEMLEKYLDLDRLQQTIPLYVSLYKQNHKGKNFWDLGQAIKEVAFAELFGIDNNPSEFKKIQSLSIDEQKKTILASAAIPLLFKAYQDEIGERYTDGGQGGYIKSQGNTPITPLLEAGCKNIIVVHVSDRALWHSHDFKEVNIVEIRPSIEIGGTLKMFDFSENTVKKLIFTGYQDTISQLSHIENANKLREVLRQSTNAMMNSISDVSTFEHLDNAMARLRASK